MYPCENAPSRRPGRGTEKMLRRQKIGQLQMELHKRLDSFDVAMHEGNETAAAAQAMAMTSAARVLLKAAKENALWAKR